MKELWKFVAYAIIGILICLNVYQCHRGRTTLPLGVYTDTLTIYDTVPVPIPTPKDSVVIRYITERLPAVVDDDNKPVEEPCDSLPTPVLPDSTIVIKQDSVKVEIPITQKVYETDRYRAVVSGYRPSLDEMHIYQPTRVVRLKDKPKRWGVGVQVGYGVTIGKQPQFSPYIGVGVSYNIWNF